MNKDNHPGPSSSRDNPLDFDEHPPTLPDFDTLRNLARNNPEALEKLRMALCDRVINEAPEHAQPRLRGLMFQINSRRELAKSDLEATEAISDMMNESLQRMQAMLKDLRTIQSESILLTTRKYSEEGASREPEPQQTARIIPFRRD